MEQAPHHPPIWRHAHSDQPARFTLADRPMLLHGTAASNASLGTAALVAAEITAQHPVVVISNQRRDIRLLQDQLALGAPTESSSQVTEPAMQNADQHLLVTLTYPQTDQLLEALRSLPDWTQRLVVVLGAEHTLTQSVWHVLQPQPNIVVCGDFHRLNFSFDRGNFKTLIGFSTWPEGWNYRRPNLPVYVGVAAEGGHEYYLQR